MQRDGSTQSVAVRFDKYLKSEYTSSVIGVQMIYGGDGEYSDLWQTAAAPDCNLRGRSPGQTRKSGRERYWQYIDSRTDAVPTPGSEKLWQNVYRRQRQNNVGR